MKPKRTIKGTVRKLTKIVTVFFSSTHLNKFLSYCLAVDTVISLLLIRKQKLMEAEEVLKFRGQ